MNIVEPPQIDPSARYGCAYPECPASTIIKSSIFRIDRTDNGKTMYACRLHLVWAQETLRQEPVRPNLIVTAIR